MFIPLSLLQVFDRYYKRRWPRQPGGAPGGGGGRKADRYGVERRRTGTDDSEQMELLSKCVRGWDDGVSPPNKRTQCVCLVGWLLVGRGTVICLLDAWMFVVCSIEWSCMMCG